MGSSHSHIWSYPQQALGCSEQLPQHLRSWHRSSVYKQGNIYWDTGRLTPQPTGWRWTGANLFHWTIPDVRKHSQHPEHVRIPARSRKEPWDWVSLLLVGKWVYSSRLVVEDLSQSSSSPDWCFSFDQNLQPRAKPCFSVHAENGQRENSPNSATRNLGILHVLTHVLS